MKCRQCPHGRPVTGAGRFSVDPPPTVNTITSIMAKKKSDAAATKRSDRSKKQPAGASGAPVINTALAAAHAARILAAKARLNIDEAEPSQVEKESGTFRKLKESLNRPHAQTVSSAMGSAFGAQRSNLPLHGGNQVAHGQTIGGVARVNVPRRTNG